MSGVIRRIGRLAWPRSLIARILLAEVATIIFVAILLPVLTASVLNRTTSRYQARTLTEQAQAIAAALEPLPPNGWRVALTDALQPIYASRYDGRAFVVVNADGRAVAASPPITALPWRQAPRHSRKTSFIAGDFIGVSLPVNKGAAQLWVIALQDENAPGVILDDVARAFLSRYLVVLLPILLLLPIINCIAIRRLVVGARAVSRQAAQIGARNLHVRLNDRAVPDEISALVHAINRLLDRLEGSFRQQGEFVANVAHELRTPLAALRLRLDTIEDDSVRTPLDRQIGRMSHVISQLRDLASLERLAADDLESFDLHTLAAELIAEQAPAVLDRAQTIALEGEEAVPVIGNPTLIGLALANLISNAIRHTPAGSAIVITVRKGATLTVADDGPGITTVDHDLLIKRFWRADRTRSDSAGIGLSIVQRIVDVHAGTLTISNGAGGGAVFTIHLPGNGVAAG